MIHGCTRVLLMIEYIRNICFMILIEKGIKENIADFLTQFVQLLIKMKIFSTMVDEPAERYPKGKGLVVAIYNQMFVNLDAEENYDGIVRFGEGVGKDEWKLGRCFGESVFNY